MPCISKQNADMYYKKTKLESIYNDGIILLAEAIINRARLDYVDALKKKQKCESLYPMASSKKRSSIKIKIDEANSMINECRRFFKENIIVSFSGADYDKIIDAIENSVE